MRFALFLLVCFPFTILNPFAVAQEKDVDFAHDVLPVLIKKCASCHSNGKSEGDFTFDNRKQLVDSGNLTPGKANESELYKRVAGTSDGEQMPPQGEKLTPKELEKFKAWIDQGAEWPEELGLKPAKSLTRSLTLKRPSQLANKPSSKHPIDWILKDYFAANKVKHPAQISDALFIRRAKLDLHGLLPSIEEVNAFKIDKSPDKHTGLIDELLKSEDDYASHWISMWNDLLRNDYAGTGYIDGGRSQISGWLYQALAENKPYDQFVRELVSPQPASAGFAKGIKWRGKVNASQIPELQYSQNVSQVFLGINMKCASCHDSFIDSWTLKDAYGLAAVIAEKPLKVHRCDKETGEIATTKFVFPELGKIDPQVNKAERMKQLAALVTSKKNGRFARTIVNRIWHRLAGRGLVHPIDVMSNEAWSEPLLEFLAIDLVENGYDLKRTIRLIATSKVYRSASTTMTKEDSQKPFVFRGISKKRMTAEQFIDAVWKVTGTGPTRIDAPIKRSINETPKIKPSAKWIWNRKDASASVPAGETVTFRYRFDRPKDFLRGGVAITCDNEFQIFLNGTKLGSGTDWGAPASYRFSALQEKDNELLVVGKNAGTTPNPAALYVEGRLYSKNEMALFKSDDKWEFANGVVVTDKQKAKANWGTAIAVANQNLLGNKVMIAIAKALRDIESNKKTLVRASLVKSNPLMRSLGRPNREQVVTTRPELLSTLEALDLTNGKLLNQHIRAGGKRFEQIQKSMSLTDVEVVNRMMQELLGRESREDERKIFLPIASDSKAHSFEDILWLTLMHPEFQLVH